MIILEFQERKLQRLKNYDYRQNGAYFITICTNNRKNLFGRVEDGKLYLNTAGDMVVEKLCEMPDFYPDIIIDKFVVMPNHLHAILQIQHPMYSQEQLPSMDLSNYIHRFKTLTTKLYIDGVKKGDFVPFNKKVWQKSYYDRVIRNQSEYEEIWQYIDTNPLKWQEDEYFI